MKGALAAAIGLSMMGQAQNLAPGAVLPAFAKGQHRGHFRGQRTKKRKRVGNPSRRHRHNNAKGLGRIVNLQAVIR